MNIKDIKGIDRINSKFYKDIETLIANAKTNGNISKIVAFGRTLDTKTGDLDPDDDLTIAVYLNNNKTYTEDDLYEYNEQLEKGTHIIYVCIMEWSDYVNNEAMNRDIKKGVALYSK